MSGSTSLKSVISTFILLLALLSRSVYAEEPMTLEVYETYHQSYRVADAISSILEPGETIKSFGNKLIVRASDATHERILYVLSEIDRAPKNFLISIRATDQYQAKKSYTTSQIKVLDDDSIVHINKENISNDEVIFYKGSSRDGKISMSVTARDNLSTHQENLIQQVRTLEGEQAYLATGSEIPVVKLVWANGDMLPVGDIDRAVTGFYVTPVMSKGSIYLDITFQKQDRKHPSQTAKTTDSVSTRVRIPSGEWSPLAGVGKQKDLQMEGTLYSTRDSNNAQKGIEIKVEILE